MKITRLVLDAKKMVGFKLRMRLKRDNTLEKDEHSVSVESFVVCKKYENTYLIHVRHSKCSCGKEVCFMPFVQFYITPKEGSLLDAANE